MRVIGQIYFKIKTFFSAEKDPKLFDYIIVNDILDKAYLDFLDAIRQELDLLLQNFK